MPRVPRIQYPNAIYHIINKGKSRGVIFHSAKYFLTFLDILSESHQKFGVVIHAYCLEKNSYHLLLETPNANLSKVMCYINRTYTQKYNYLQKSRGALFAGRFKAILIEKENYLLSLTRYIHQSPIDSTKKLENYKWSSYPAYINLVKSPIWLDIGTTAKLFGKEDFAKKYKKYVTHDHEDDLLEEVYCKKKLPSIFGDSNFKQQIYKNIPNAKELHKKKIINSLKGRMVFADIVESVAKVFNVSAESIIDRQVGRAKSNFPRKFAMYLCQIHLQKTLAEIVIDYNLKNPGSVAKAISLVKKEIKNIQNSPYKKEIELVRRYLWFIERS